MVLVVAVAVGGETRVGEARDRGGENRGKTSR